MYRIGQDKLLFNARMLAYWLCNALFHSVVCFLVPMFLCLSVVARDGTGSDLYSMGLYTYTGVVYVCCGKVLIMTRSHNIVTFLSIIASILLWFIWLLAYSFILIESSQLTFWNLGYEVMRLPSWWLCTALIPVLALSRDFAWRAYKDLFLPNQVVIARYVKKHNKLAMSSSKEVIITPEDKQKQREAEQQKSARMQEVIEQRRISNIRTLKQNSSAVGFVEGARDSDGVTDWEKRIKKVLEKETKKKEKREKIVASKAKKTTEDSNV